MTRRECICLTLLFAGCTRQPRPLEEALPASPGEGWILTGASPVPPENAPGMVRQLGLRRAVRASYQGAGELQVTLYEMVTPASAFELVQKWRTEESAVHFHHERYFVLVESGQLDTPALLSFVRLLEKQLK